MSSVKRVNYFRVVRFCRYDFLACKNNILHTLIQHALHADTNELQFTETIVKSQIDSILLCVGF